MRIIPNTDLSISRDGLTLLNVGDKAPRRFHINIDGYLIANLPTKGRLSSTGKVVKEKERVHRLVALAYIPNPNNLPQVNHINGVKTDNRADNLEWCTAKHNCNHAQETGLCNEKNHKHSLLLKSKPSSHYSSMRRKARRFSLEQILYIRSKSNIKEERLLLASEFAVKDDAIYRIMTRKSYKDL